MNNDDIIGILVNGNGIVQFNTAYMYSLYTLVYK